MISRRPCKTHKRAKNKQKLTDNDNDYTELNQKTGIEWEKRGGREKREKNLQKKAKEYGKHNAQSNTNK